MINFMDQLQARDEMRRLHSENKAGGSKIGGYVSYSTAPMIKIQ